MSQIGVYAEQGGGGTGILYVEGNDAVQVGADANNTIYITGVNPLYTSGDSATNTLQLSLTSVYNWQIVSGTTPIALTSMTAYIAKGSSAVTFTLPPTANVGDTFKIVGYGNLWQLQQNASQKIVCGVMQTTAGASGYLQATVATDQVEIVCVTPNTEFYVIQVIGNPSFN